MTVAPTSPGLKLTNAELLCALRRRLGNPVLAFPGRCEGCRRPLDAQGHHRTTCPRTGRNHALRRTLVGLWRQVFVETGGTVPRRNVERMLRNTNVPTDPGCNLRLDLVVPGLGVERGLPLFCDATCVSPLTGRGESRRGSQERDGSVLEYARRDNAETYAAVPRSGVGSLLCLSVETFGRWGEDCLRILLALAAQRAEGLPALVRTGVAMRLLTRWWGLLAVGVQRAVATAALRDVGHDLVGAPLEVGPAAFELPAQ